MSVRALSDDQVREIRKKYKETEMLPIGNPERITLKQLSEEYGISSGNIHRIITGQTYKDVTDEA